MRQLILLLTLTLALNAPKLLAQIQNPANKEIFTAHELKTLNRLIEFYDSTVLSRTSSLDLKTAYYQYFDSIFPIVIETGEDTILAIDNESRTRFFSSLNQDFLKEIYEIRDSVTYMYRGVYKTIYSPYILSLNFDGKYVDYLKHISNYNKFLKKYYDGIEATHAFNPTGFAQILTEYRDLDIENLQERLVIIIHLLKIDKLQYN